MADDKKKEAIKQWKDEKHPRYPAPKFQIGDIVKLVNSDDPDELAIVVGIRLRYYSHMHQHVYYYEIGDARAVQPSRPTGLMPMI
jgi:hypothetical protein